MKINLNCISCLIIINLLSYTLSAQTIIGKITNEDQKPVPYAHIVLQGTTRGTISNDSGYFKLKLPDNIKHIKISSIGYKTQLIEKSSLGHDGINNIILENDRLSLAEVEVSGTFDSARFFMKQVIKKLRKNYPSKNYSQVAFYREAMVQDSTYKRAVEAIVLMSDRGFRKESNLTQYELIQLRKSKENRDQDFRNELSDWLYQDSGPHYINKMNPIKPMDGINADLTEKILNPRLYKERKEKIERFLHKGMLEHCLFEITNKYKTENDELIEISIAPLSEAPFDKWIGAYGKFIISRNDMAVISHERYQYGKQGTIFRNNSIKDSTRAYYYIEYKKRKEDGKYYTHYIKEMSMGTNTGGLLGSAKSADFWKSGGKKGGIYSVNEWFVMETRDFVKIQRDDQMYIDEDIYYTKPTKRFDITFDDLNIIQMNPINQKIKKDLQSDEQKNKLFIDP